MNDLGHYLLWELEMKKLHQGRRNRLSTSAAGLLACLILASMHPAMASQEYEQHVAEANESYENGEYKKALKAFETANELAGGKAEQLLLGMAASHYQLKNYKKTIETAQRLLQFAEKRATRIRAYNILGVALYMRNRNDKDGLAQAEAAFRETIELVGDKSKAVSPRYGLAEVLRALGRDSEAMSIMQEILGEESVDDFPQVDNIRIALCSLRRSSRAAGKQGTSPPSQEESQQEREGTAETVYVGGVVTPPERILDPQPQYSVEARMARVQGVVIVQAIIDRDGCVTSVKVLKGLDADLDKNAIDAISRWVFKPATLEGKPVDVYYNLTVNFRLSRGRRLTN